MTGEEHGFTLIELLIAISVLGLVATAVVGLITTSIRTTSDTQERLKDTGAYMITSGYFGPDIQGANSVTANNQPGYPPGTATSTCPADDDPNAPLVMELTGLDYESTSHDRPTTVTYVLTDDGRTLVRRLCAGSDPSPASVLIMAEDLDPARPPTVTCRTRKSDGAYETKRCEEDSSGTVTLTLTTAGGVTEPLVGGRRTS